MLGEPNIDRIVLVIKEFTTFVHEVGMEGVFNIVLQDGSTLDMLTKTGRLTSDIVETWCKDLTVDGVIDASNPSQRLPVCPHDITNINWSGSALLNSSTETLHDEVKEQLSSKPLYGPRLFFAIVDKVYRSGRGRVKELVAKLEALKLTDFPAENVSLYNQAAYTLVREIKLNFMKPDHVPDLTTSALNGLKCCSDPFLKSKVTELSIASDSNMYSFVPGQAPKAMEVFTTLGHVESIWTVLKNQNNY